MQSPSLGHGTSPGVDDENPVVDRMAPDCMEVVRCHVPREYTFGELHRARLSGISGLPYPAPTTVKPEDRPTAVLGPRPCMPPSPSTVTPYPTALSRLADHRERLLRDVSVDERLGMLAEFASNSARSFHDDIAVHAVVFRSSKPKANHNSVRPQHHVRPTHSSRD